jgi:hypothetical protein
MSKQDMIISLEPARRNFCQGYAFVSDKLLLSDDDRRAYWQAVAAIAAQRIEEPTPKTILYQTGGESA